MRLLYLNYPKCQTASVKLNWSHYCELLSISDEKTQFLRKEGYQHWLVGQGGLSSNIFASKYTYYIPQKEQLIAEVEKVINRWHEKNDDK